MRAISSRARLRAPAVALGAVLTALAVLAGPAAATPAYGWQQFNLPATGSYMWRYIPASLAAGAPAPLVIFLHGSGGTPEDYKDYVFPAAEHAGCVVALPKSASDAGWGTGGDEQTVALTVQEVEAELAVDPNRVSIAGHSSGGAYAYLLAYGTASKYNAVFSLSAPFYAVSGVADPLYKAPIHMYYGTMDPNYSGGAEAALRQQWDHLGIAWEEDVEPGYGHNYWPPDSMTKGFLFLAGKSYSPAPPPTCVPDPNHLCLLGQRFRVEVGWQDGGGHSGVATASPAVSANSGVFWFFSPDNWEMLVKVLDGCALNHKVWVFAAATTDVAYTLTVTDTQTQQQKSYVNPAGQTAHVVTDTDAFAACP
jgi:predicted esterase